MSTTNRGAPRDSVLYFFASSAWSPRLTGGRIPRKLKKRLAVVPRAILRLCGLFVSGSNWSLER